jgi:hypothetical protein
VYPIAVTLPHYPWFAHPIAAPPRRLKQPGSGKPRGAMRALFAIYLCGIVLIISYFVVIGLTHH